MPKEDTNRVLVRFLENRTPYIKGESARLMPRAAKKYIDEEVCEVIEGDVDDVITEEMIDAIRSKQGVIDVIAGFGGDVSEYEDEKTLKESKLDDLKEKAKELLAASDSEIAEQ